jgi:uncharacterized membrane protein
MAWKWTAGFALIVGLIGAACHETRTEQVTGPSAVTRCQVTLSPPSSIPSSANAFSIALTTGRECMWSLNVDGSWLTVEPRSGQGDATLTATAAENPQGRTRSASLAINDQRVAITQQPAPCRFSVTPTRIAMRAEGGRSSVQLSTLDGCAWTTQISQSWVRVVAPSSGEGSRTIELAIDSNPADDRSGELRIQDASVAIVQESIAESDRGCPYSMGAGSANFAAGGGTGAVRLHTRPTCAWGAASSQPWVVILSTRNGVGTGDIDYRVEANQTARSRTATITAGGRQHIVRQAAR